MNTPRAIGFGVGRNSHQQAQAPRSCLEIVSARGSFSSLLRLRNHSADRGAPGSAFSFLGSELVSFLAPPLLVLPHRSFFRLRLRPRAFPVLTPGVCSLDHVHVLIPFRSSACIHSVTSVSSCQSVSRCCADHDSRVSPYVHSVTCSPAKSVCVLRLRAGSSALTPRPRPRPPKRAQASGFSFLTHRLVPSFLPLVCCAILPPVCSSSCCPRSSLFFPCSCPRRLPFVLESTSASASPSHVFVFEL
jgi:hypothetical protein